MRRGGFTFIEMSVVILVLALVAAIVAPNISAMIDSQQTQSFRIDAERIARQARAEAISQGDTVRLTFSGVLRAAQVSEELEAAEEEAGGAAIAEVDLPEGVTAVAFRANGQDVGPEDWRAEFYAGGDARSGGITFDSSGRIWHLLIQREGQITVGEGELPPAEADRWEAGLIETRTTQ